MSLNTCFGTHCVAGAHFGETVSCENCVNIFQRGVDSVCWVGTGRVKTSPSETIRVIVMAFARAQGKAELCVPRAVLSGLGCGCPCPLEFTVNHARISARQGSVSFVSQVRSNRETPGHVQVQRAPIRLRSCCQICVGSHFGPDRCGWLVSLLRWG